MQPAANPKKERKASRKIPQGDPIKPYIPRARRESPARIRALHVLARMRRTGESLVSSSRLEGLDPRTVLKQIPREFHKSRGRWVPLKTADREPRPMRLLDDKGRRPGVVRGSKAASLLGRYNAALSKFFSANKKYVGNETLLKPFRGKRVGGVELLTDPSKLLELADAGELRTGEDLYAAPTGGPE